MVVQGVLAEEGHTTRLTGPFTRLFDLGVALLGGGSLPFVPAFEYPSLDSGIMSVTSSDHLLFASSLHLCFLDSNLVHGETCLASDQFRDSDVTAATIIFDVVQRPGQHGRHAISLGSRLHSPERKRKKVSSMRRSERIGKRSKGSGIVDQQSTPLYVMAKPLSIAC